MMTRILRATLCLSLLLGSCISSDGETEIPKARPIEDGQFWVFDRTGSEQVILPQPSAVSAARTWCCGSCGAGEEGAKVTCANCLAAGSTGECNQTKLHCPGIAVEVPMMDKGQKVSCF